MLAMEKAADRCRLSRFILEVSVVWMNSPS